MYNIVFLGLSLPAWITVVTVITLFLVLLLTKLQEDIAFLAKSAYADACRPGNPRDVSVKEIERLYKSLA